MLQVNFKTEIFKNKNTTDTRDNQFEAQEFNKHCCVHRGKMQTEKLSTRRLQARREMSNSEKRKMREVKTANSAHTSARRTIMNCR
jgi:hypothetical protein